TFSSSAVRAVVSRDDRRPAITIVSSLSAARASLFAERAASGNATSAVTSTEISAATHVTTTALAVRVLRKRVGLRGLGPAGFTGSATVGSSTVAPARSGIGRVADTAYRPDHARRRSQLRAYLCDMDIDGTGAAVCGVAPDRAEQLLAGEHPA